MESPDSAKRYIYKEIKIYDVRGGLKKRCCFCKNVGPGQFTHPTEKWRRLRQLEAREPSCIAPSLPLLPKDVRCPLSLPSGQNRGTIKDKWKNKKKERPGFGAGGWGGGQQGRSRETSKHKARGEQADKQANEQKGQRKKVGGIGESSKTFEF